MRHRATALPHNTQCDQGPSDAKDVTTTPSLRTYVGVSATTTSRALQAALVVELVVHREQVRRCSVYL